MCAYATTGYGNVWRVRWPRVDTVTFVPLKSVLKFETRGTRVPCPIDGFYEAGRFCPTERASVAAFSEFTAVFSLSKTSHAIRRRDES